MKGVFAIPLGQSFLPALVEGLLAETTQNPLALASYLILLPTQRGCLALSKAFQTATPSGCRILPRIMALADIEDGGSLPGYSPPEDLPPAMPSWQRLGLLTQLVLAFEKQKGIGSPNPASAVRLAQELMRLVDEVETTSLDLQDLKSLVGADYAAHWQLTLDFLKILTDLWPPILSQAGYIEPAARKRLILEQVATHWRPTYPVILAGTTGTRPATALLAQSILKMDQGRVILPGVDFEDLSDTLLPPTHPQYTLSQIINQIGKPTIYPGCDRKPTSRAAFLSKAMMPNGGENWHLSPKEASEITQHIQGIEAASVLDEAHQIALIMRAELETPGHIIALVTPDSDLTRQVRAALGRWGLHANLSSGVPLCQSLVGRFLSLTSQLTQELGAADLLSLLKHPLFAKGQDRLTHLQETRQFEIKSLRGLAPGRPMTLSFPGHDLIAPLKALQDNKLHPFEEFLEAHATVAEALVGDATLLWGEEDGQAALAFWKTLKEHAHAFPALAARDYPGVLHHLMAQEVVRDVKGIGSRLLILGALEARLLQADVVILGELNEGKWPGAPDDDPWLSRPMRESFGLPSLERKIGLSAHDFCTAMSAQKVYLTRALKRDGAPTLPSRWWQRLTALLDTGGGKLQPHQPWGAWRKHLNTPLESILFTPPEPCPPLEARPKKLSVTAVEMLMKDPYSIYAKTILKVRPLEPLEADLSALERGEAIHDILDAFMRSGIHPASPEAIETIQQLGEKAFERLIKDPRAQAFWWPRFQRLSTWFLSELALDFPLVSHTEKEGSLSIPTSHDAVLLTTKADRIDIQGNQARLIDYKTGGLPTVKSVSQGYAPQLPLEGLILLLGGFPDLGQRQVEELAYWRLTGGTPAGEIRVIKNPVELIKAADRGVNRLFQAFFGKGIPFYACPDPNEIPAFHDYAHLERLKEWG